MAKTKKPSKLPILLISPVLLVIWMLGWTAFWIGERQKKTILRQVSIIQGSTCTYNLQQNEESMKCSKP